jgi:hypothetical protein
MSVAAHCGVSNSETSPGIVIMKRILFGDRASDGDAVTTQHDAASAISAVERYYAEFKLVIDSACCSTEGSVLRNLAVR